MLGSHRLDWFTFSVPSEGAIGWAWTRAWWREEWLVKVKPYIGGQSEERRLNTSSLPWQGIELISWWYKWVIEFFSHNKKNHAIWQLLPQVYAFLPAILGRKPKEYKHCLNSISREIAIYPAELQAEVSKSSVNTPVKKHEHAQYRHAASDHEQG